MTKLPPHKMPADEWDELHFPRPEENEFDRVVERAISRRGFLSGLVAFGSGAVAMGTGLLNSTSAQAQAASRFPFTPIDAQTDMTVHVPEGWNWKTMVSWGDPLFDNVADFDATNGVTAADSDKVFGENTDGMETFQIGSHEIIAINNEYVNSEINLPHTPDGVPQSAEDVRTLQNFQGVTVMEIAEGENGYAPVKNSRFNRRLHHNAEMAISGPAAGHALMQTAADSTGTKVLGTMGNCGAGKTPWGTYLTCEENFNGYFGGMATGISDTVKAGYDRYGLGDESQYGYEKFDPRFDLGQNPNEPHRFGWVVEIDPTNPESTPVKRTALGRFKHENAEVTLAPDGRVVVYLGDDERGEFLYRYVSTNPYVAGQPTDGLLDDGILYVAKFHDDQTGEWLAMTPETTGMEMAEMLIFARQAASKVGATTMDRPEWIAVNPYAVEAYCCLTNNKNRGVKPNAGGDDTAVNGPNPRNANNYGQIVRWYPSDDNHAGETFKWDLFVMAGNPEVHSDAYAGSKNVTGGNMFNSPDGMTFDSAGLLWIQTDGEDSNEGDYAGMGNNQQLAGDPTTGEIARFLTGPNGCEITGLCWSADRRTMFVGIQHPGGSWPAESGLPRSSVIAVKRDDGQLVG
ncbi:PhoX family phosphatase (plasmid) [Thioclava sp. 'Guangxiensis']|uniref:PhoX family protein n=1 Tax=Thioclava sp. 'Guangxiensis' TaxID=3149044 RepID=UPI0032C49828